MLKKSLPLILVVLTFACKKDVKPKNPYVGTSWTATDDIAEFLYGPTCTTTIEFMSGDKCQQIDIRKTKGFGSGTNTQQGTYYVKNDSVYWKIDKTQIGGIAVGGVLNTNMGKVAGGKRVYTRDK
ncbi:hypothetical protein [Emticicia sp. TH156]|uniref:hypothetical protein n=1 Tax=Emticicia sp. TH156 TaxID=2067454 RepID=UPI000C77B228|nr:hypothetical protein [Emticicia sp. TH156]PLK44375.1 hypothetical protein C0V77_11350 [Emticicia sp. TH156]